MARRYTRREFICDAMFMLGTSVLLHFLAPPAIGATPTDPITTPPVATRDRPED